MTEQRALTVSEFLAVVNQLLGGAEAVVEGEVSGFSVSQGKWVFFCLKDQEQDAVVECFMMAYQLAQPLENGMLARVVGRPGVHLRSGRFRISVTRVEPVGEGALARALALLKAKLEKEGIFAPERKRPLPFAPEVIGLVASRESAAYSDFLKVLRHRFGGLTVLVRHVQVEGAAAIPDIVQGLRAIAAAQPRPEVMVLTRGGGSLESLAAFNSEEVARVIFASPIPVVVGVGHERDVTLADLAADVRASTPSNAAELVAPDRAALLDELTGTIEHLTLTLERQLADEALIVRRFHLSGSQFIKVVGERITVFSRRAWTAVSQQLARAFDAVARSERLLNSFNPKAVLGRGYSIVRRRVDRTLLRSVRQVAVGQALSITLQDGSVEAEAK